MQSIALTCEIYGIFYMDLMVIDIVSDIRLNHFEYDLVIKSGR